MRHASLEPAKRQRSALTKIGGSRTRRLTAIGALLMVVALLAAAVRAYNHASLSRLVPAEFATARAQGSSALPPGRLKAKLSFQIEADKLRRRLGQRFLAAGRERTTIVGTLSVGTELHPVGIVRTQDENGERVAIGLDDLPALLTWTATEGARSAGLPTTAATRALIERIALDSPDQFVLAQLRGTSYRTVARKVVPSGAAGLEDYSGPAWDVVLVRESDSSGNRPLSESRLYYINTKSGLLDKVVSREGSETVVAEFSGWANHLGEKVPTRVIWRKGDQIVMELNISGVSHLPLQ